MEEKRMYVHWGERENESMQANAKAAKLLQLVNLEKMI